MAHSSSYPWQPFRTRSSSCCSLVMVMLGALCNPRVLHLQIQWIMIKNILKQIPKSFKKKKLNFFCISNHFHSIYIVFTTIYIAFTLIRYKYSRDNLKCRGEYAWVMCKYSAVLYYIRDWSIHGCWYLWEIWSQYGWGYQGMNVCVSCSTLLLIQ